MGAVWQSASPTWSPRPLHAWGPTPHHRPAVLSPRTHLDSPTETGLATGWCDRRADRDRILLLALRGEAGLADASSLLEEDTGQRARVSLHIEAQGATPQPLSSAWHRRAKHCPHGSPRDSTQGTQAPGSGFLSAAARVSERGRGGGQACELDLSPN